VATTGVDNVGLNIYSVGGDEIPPKDRSLGSAGSSGDELNPLEHYEAPEEEHVITNLLIFYFTYY
jgi:hypothetical protein